MQERSQLNIDYHWYTVADANELSFSFLVCGSVLNLLHSFLCHWLAGQSIGFAREYSSINVHVFQWWNFKTSQWKDCSKIFSMLIESHILRKKCLWKLHLENSISYLNSPWLGSIWISRTLHFLGPGAYQIPQIILGWWLESGLLWIWFGYFFNMFNHFKPFFG